MSIIDKYWWDINLKDDSNFDQTYVYVKRFYVYKGSLTKTFTQFEMWVFRKNWYFVIE